MSETTNKQWEAEPAFVGDDVYHGTDIVTDIDDVDGNPLVVVAQTGSRAQDKKLADRIVRAVNSHDDLLRSLREARAMLVLMGVSMTDHEVTREIDAAIAKAQGH